MAPTIPGRMAPGLYNSASSPMVPKVMRMNAMFGSLRALSASSRQPMGLSFSRAPFVRSTTLPAPVTISRPSTADSRDGTSSAIRSITFNDKASFSVTDTLLRTASSAHLTFRPRLSAMDLI